jgi:hypothetical protein
VSYFGAKFKLGKSGFHFSDLSPIGSVIISDNYPTCFTIDGLYTFCQPKHRYGIDLYKIEDFYFVSYQDIGEIEADGKIIKIGKKTAIKTPSLITSNDLVSTIKEFKGLDSSKRFKRVQSILSESFDLGAIRRLKSCYSELFLFLKTLCCFMFVNTFILLPLVLYSSLYLYISFTIIAINIILSYLLILGLTYSGHKKIYKAERLQRVYTLLSLLFLPVTAMHALSYLTKDLYSRFDYLTVASTLMPSDAFRELARKELFRIDYLISQIEDTDLISFLNLKKNHLHHLIRENGLSIEDVFATPEKHDEMALSYCPYCLCEYTKDLNECPDCGIKLKMF